MNFLKFVIAINFSNTSHVVLERKVPTIAMNNPPVYHVYVLCILICLPLADESVGYSPLCPSLLNFDYVKVAGFGLRFDSSSISSEDARQECQIENADFPLLNSENTKRALIGFQGKLACLQN